MRLRRHVKMLRGPADAAAVAGALLLLWTVTLMHSSLVMPPGIRLQLPDAPGIWGDTLPRFALAVDPAGRCVFENEIVPESNLLARLKPRVAASPTNSTLLLLADRTVPVATLARLANLARSAGVRDVVLATSPVPGGPPGEPAPAKP